MLLALKVHNYALIEELYVQFHGGLNIITGETGAGKSILLGALGLILGKRADTTVLSNPEKKCVVEAEFDVKGYQLENHFEENDLDFDNHTYLRREILSSGKSRAFINDTPVNLATLQQLALKLVDIHSQHQTLMLNQQSFLLNIIDKYGKHSALISDYKVAYKSYEIALKDYNEKKLAYDAIKADIDFIAHQVDELAKARVRIGELEELEADLKALDNSGEIKTALHSSIQRLSSEEGVLSSLQLVSSYLSKISGVYTQAADFFERLESSRIELKELDADLNMAFENLEFDPEAHEQKRQRYDYITSILQKYNLANEGELLSVLNNLEEKLTLSVDGGYELEQIGNTVKTLETQARSLALELSNSRKGQFDSIESKVVQTLKDLGIPHGQLKIELTGREFSNSGMDQVRFTFTANKNHPLQDISKIASGGELSRLMLAIKALISTESDMPTIILDEIDTGVSGEIAGKVGSIIHKMGEGMQVINITHLPQVASKGEAHYKVYKDHAGMHSKTKITKLTEKERLEEIAKMLSGEELTEAAWANAKSLLGL